MAIRDDRCFTFGVLVYAWSALFVAGALAGCGDNHIPEPDPDLVTVQPCTDFEADILPWESSDVVPSITPADLGVRIIVPTDFDPFFGASYSVPGGRMAWSVWVYHWYDGDHLGTIGRLNGSTTCMWYAPL
jgi:hypothetical protein